MFTELIQYNDIIEKIADLDLTESQVDSLLLAIKENPSMSAPQLLEIGDKLSQNEEIIMGSGTFSIHPILNESDTVTMSLLEFIVPAISKHIPNDVLGYLTESHAVAIIDTILDMRVDSNISIDGLHNKIDEMFSAGDIGIPLSGLRKQSASVDVIMNGMFGPILLHKGIQFKKDQYNQPMLSQSKNNGTLRNVLKDYEMVGCDTDSPLSKLLPKFIIMMKRLMGDKK